MAQMPYVVCKVCKNSFYVKPSHQKLGWGKLCSIECRKKFQLKGKFLNCQKCGKEIYRGLSQIKKSKSGLFFCNRKCQTHWRNKKFVENKHPNWKSGIRSYRNIILRNNKKLVCFGCGAKDKRVLVVHHIDEDRTNNNIDNLLWMCHNCHHLVHNHNEFHDKINKLKN